MPRHATLLREQLKVLIEIQDSLKDRYADPVDPGQNAAYKWASGRIEGPITSV